MPNRLAYRRAALRALGTLHTGTAAPGSTTALLQTDAWPFRSTLSQNERFEHWFVHRPAASLAADRARTVATGGYDAIAGTFTPDLVWGSAPAVGEPFELFGVVDPDTVHRLINEALHLVPVVVEVPFTPASATARRHSLADAAPWLTDAADVYRVGRLGPGAARAETDPFASPQRGSAYERGGKVYLEGPSYGPGETGYALCARPADTYCRQSAGVYGDLTDGLGRDTDEAAVEADTVAAGVKMLAWDELRDLFWPGEARTAEVKVAQAAARFWALVRAGFREPERRFTPLRAWGAGGTTGPRVPVG